MSFGQEQHNYQDVSGFRPQSGSAHSDGSSPVGEVEFIAKVYNWMALGLTLTAVTSFLLLNLPSLLLTLCTPPLFYILLFAELGLVFYLSARIGKMSSATASGMFLLYSVLNGITLTPIFLIYTGTSIASTFVICAGTFGAVSFYGYTTKKDLTSMGSFLMMALVGLIISSVVNMILGSPMVYYISGFIGVVVFVLLTAYDTQKIKMMAQGRIDDGPMAEKAAIMGALALYLDFINLFLYLLRFFGNRRD